MIQTYSFKASTVLMKLWTSRQPNMKILKEDKYMILNISKSSTKRISLHFSLKKTCGNMCLERILILKLIKALQKMFKRHNFISEFSLEIFREVIILLSKDFSFLKQKILNMSFEFYGVKYFKSILRNIFFWFQNLVFSELSSTEVLFFIYFLFFIFLFFIVNPLKFWWGLNISALAHCKRQIHILLE